MALVEIRRATLDDLPALRAFWKQSGQVAQEKNLTEFQLALDEAGKILGAVALKISQNQGLVHSGVISLDAPPGIEDKLWERVQAASKNNGLYRLWQKGDFFQTKGFQIAEAALREKLPPAFGEWNDRWQVMKLREETVLTLEQELNLFAQAQQQSTARLMEQARWFKVFAYILLLIFLGAILVAGILFMKRYPLRR